MAHFISHHSPEDVTVPQVPELSAPPLIAHTHSFLQAQPLREPTHYTPSDQPQAHHMSTPSQDTHHMPTGFHEPRRMPNSTDISQQGMHVVPATLAPRMDPNLQWHPTYHGEFVVDDAVFYPPALTPEQMMIYSGQGAYSSPLVYSHAPGYVHGEYHAHGFTDSTPVASSLGQPIMGTNMPPYCAHQYPPNFPSARANEEWQRPYNAHNHRLSQEPGPSSNWSPGPPHYRPPRGPSTIGRRPTDRHTPAAAMQDRSAPFDPSDLIPRPDMNWEVVPRAPQSRHHRRRPASHPFRLSARPTVQKPQNKPARNIQDLKRTLPNLLPSELPAGTSTTCDICIKEYHIYHVLADENQETAIALPCGHYFGEWCIFQWFDTCEKFKNKVTCPMCRMLLVDPARCDSAVGLREMNVDGMWDDPPALREYMGAESRFETQREEFERLLREEIWRMQRRMLE